MRKTSKYARKRGQTLGLLPAPDYWACIIGRSRPFTDEPVIPGTDIGSTQGTVFTVSLKARAAFEAMRDGMGTRQDWELLCEILGEAQIRAAEIEGVKGGELAATLAPAINAMRRVRDRYHRVGKFGLDGPALHEIPAGLDVYDAILQASSPAQMANAALKRVQVVNKQMEVV
jgi:hypothetical protein